MKVWAGVRKHTGLGVANQLDKKNTYYMVGIERNKDPELSPKERNTSYFVLLDDRKHGRSGKFPVFYDIDTGDYLEPPVGFLESDCQTLKEWYMSHPEDDPNNFQVEGVKELSAENKIKEHSDLTEEDIPPDNSVVDDNAEDIPDDIPEEPVVEAEPEIQQLAIDEEDFDDLPPF